MKRYVWGFPGVGKSSLNIPGFRAVDADCRLFEFQGVVDADLHNGATLKHYERNEDYPQNYFTFIQNVDVDVVFLNCHINLLERLNKEDVLIVYPCEDLIKEYLERYRQRGDGESFVSDMSSNAVHIIQHIQSSGFEKYQVLEKGVFLTDLFERNDFKMKLMTKKELTEQLQRAKDLDLLGIDEDQHALECDVKYLNDTSTYGILAETLADDVFNGKYSLDIDQLNEVCSLRETELKKEFEDLFLHFQRAIELNVLDTTAYNNEILCDLSFVDDNIASGKVHDAYDLADQVMNGQYTVNIDNLLLVCQQREEQLDELKFAEARGGLSRKELADKIMLGIVNGALGIRYSEVAPYSHGYEVTFGREGTDFGSTRDFINRWECYCDLFDIPETIVKKIENGQQSSVYRGDRCEELDIKKMISAIDEAEKFKINSFVPEKDAGLERRRRYRGHVASVMDVHYGRALDGIVQHHFHGDYSSMTPGSQNDLVEALVCMKGFCLDCLDGISGGADRRLKIVEYLKEHGTDVSTPLKVKAWIQLNPDKCGKSENRYPRLPVEKEFEKKPSLDTQIETGASKSAECDVRHNKIINRGEER